MPVEGLESATPPAAAPANTAGTAAAPASPTTQAQTTPDAAGNNTGASATPSGEGTQTPKAPEAQPEKTFTQADVDRIVANRIKSGVKAELKKLTGEGDGPATVEELQRQLSEEKARTRAIEAREEVRDYLTDAKHKLNIKAENIRAIEKLVLPDLEYDDNGKPSNLKEAIESAKSLAPALFVNTPVSINANQGRNNGMAAGSDMNEWIRRQHAGG